MLRLLHGNADAASQPACRPAWLPAVDILAPALARPLPHSSLAG